MRGGARANSGPPPDANALRRDRKSDQAGWTILDAAGRKGKPPAWPLSEQTVREAELWRAEWKRPQAIEWERNGQEVEVALYVRSVVAAERADAPTNARTLVKQMQEALGLSLPGLQRQRWKIGEAESTQRARPSRSGAASARDRFKVIEGGETS